MRRSIIPSDSQFCVSRGGNIESANHLLIHFPIFGMFWQHVKTWIGVESVDPQQVQDHSIQLAHSSGAFKSRRMFLL